MENTIKILYIGKSQESIDALKLSSGIVLNVKDNTLGAIQFLKDE